jgi:hypothetical protein
MLFTVIDDFLVKAFCPTTDFHYKLQTSMGQ